MNFHTWSRLALLCALLPWLLPQGIALSQPTSPSAAQKVDFSDYEKIIPWTVSDELKGDYARRQPENNFEEDLVPDYTLPDLFTLQDGGRVTDAATWERERRGELLEMLRSEVYGVDPPKPASLRFRVVETDAEAMSGAASRKQVSIEFELGDATFAIPLTLFVPNSRTGAAPVFLLLNHRGSDNTDPTRAVQSPFWPAEYVVDRGYAIAAINVADGVEPDEADSPIGLRAFYRAHAKNAAEFSWGALSSWGWAGSRALDYFETDADIDAAKAAVVGHSRSGKAAVWAGARDTRFAMVCANNAGEGGTSLSRRRVGNYIREMTRKNPHWFAPQYATYTDREETMPFDAHMTIALVASRGYHDAEASQDLWADPRGAWLALVEASKVWALYGAAAAMVGDMPPVNALVLNGPLGYHMRAGGHDLNTFDWKCYLDHADLLYSASR